MCIRYVDVYKNASIVYIAGAAAAAAAPASVLHSHYYSALERTRSCKQTNIFAYTI